jgi:flagellar basal-body rod protein FlgG
MGNYAQAIAAIGLHAHQRNIETIANNLTNVSTPGFKSGRVNFAQLMSPASGSAAVGAPLGAVSNDFAVGKLAPTESPLDLAIDGAGFIAVELPDGVVGYTRAGRLQVNADGFLATAQGLVLRARIQVPQNYTALQIGSDGRVRVHTPDVAAPLEVGELPLAGFVNPAGLQSAGAGIYVPGELSGPASEGRPGENGLGRLVQYRVEGSNVDMITEMTSLVEAQRAFEMSSKAFAAADELLQMANNLRR